MAQLSVRVQGLTASPPTRRRSFARRGECQVLSSRFRRKIETSHLRLLAFSEAGVRADRTKKRTQSVSMVIAFLGF